MTSLHSTTTHRTYQLRAYTSRAGVDRFERVLDLTRYLYNAALEHRRTAYRQSGDSVSFNQQSKELTGVRADDPEHAAVNRRVEVGALRRLDKAFQAFFRRIRAGETPGYPRFKPASRWRTIEPWGVEAAWIKHVEGRPRAYIKINGLPRLTVKPRQPLPPNDRLKQITLTRRGRRIVANLTYEVEVERAEPTGALVGLDMGVANRITTSDSDHIPGVERDRRRLRRLQRKMARRRRPKGQKASRGYRRAREELAREAEALRIRNRNACHQLTTALVRDYDFIAVEKLPIKNMSKSAKGTEDSPGKNVAQKRGLNRSILEQTWGMIHSQIEYKAGSAGKRFVAVDPRYTSQECSRCGNVDARSRRSQSEYRCVSCGLRIHADVNAAINILNRAMEIYDLPRGGDPGGLKPSSARAVGLTGNRGIGAGARENPYAPWVST